MEFCAELIKEVKKRNIKDSASLSKLKQELSKKYNLKKSPTTIELRSTLSEKDYASLKHLLVTKPVRTISGVAPVALMTAPLACKHGVCIFCPGGPNSYFGDIAQSYTGNEPASRRGLRNNWDPYLQVMNRLEHYALLNHDFSKCEVIIMGGTFPSY